MSDELEELVEEATQVVDDASELPDPESMPAPSQADQLQAAEAKGDYQESLAIKVQTMQQWFRDPQE